MGIVIDSDLLWKSHTDYLFRKLLKFTGIFYKLRSRAQPKVLRMLYFTFVYPQLLYGVEVYANACKSHLEKLIVLSTINCCALRKTAQYEHVLWICTNVLDIAATITS